MSTEYDLCRWSWLLLPLALCWLGLSFYLAPGWHGYLLVAFGPSLGALLHALLRRRRPVEAEEAS
ncbi:MAG TPA: hypothetical protein VLI06_14800 [Solimonas sp.]|nr:hypothetical protein [Solimonas sp.]